MTGGAGGWWIVLLAVLGGAVRVSTPFLFVSLGECITEKSGRINLGLEGTLVMGAMSGYAVSYLSGSPWLGVLAAGAVGVSMGLLHGSHLQLASGQRHRRRDRADAVRGRARRSTSASPLSSPQHRNCRRSISAGGAIRPTCRTRSKSMNYF